MGFLIEKVDGKNGEIDDLEACESIVQRLHSLGIVHGDLNKYNFIIGPTKTTLVDFENSTKNGSKEEMQKEFTGLTEQLTEETGRGGPFRAVYDAQIHVEGVPSSRGIIEIQINRFYLIGLRYANLRYAS